MEDVKLSKKGNELIRLYEEMAKTTIKRRDGKDISSYNDFQLRKFRNILKDKLSNEVIKTVLDYGGGGSDWNAPGFDPGTKQSAKNFFQIQEVHNFEPARGLFEKKQADCVVCMDVLEHIFMEDIPGVVSELFSLSKKLLIVNVACYLANALLPNGENAHITIRSPDWWRGVFDVVSSDYKNIEVILICSINFHSGIRYETFKFGDWSSSKEFTTSCKYTAWSINSKKDR